MTNIKFSYKINEGMISGNGIYDTDTNKTIILKGSKINQKSDDKYSGSFKARAPYKQLLSFIESGKIVDGEVVEDCECSSPSAACSIVKCNNSNYLDFKTEDGKPLYKEVLVSYLKKHILEYNEFTEEAEKEIKNFTGKYPLDELKDLSIEQYDSALMKDSFTNLIEHYTLAVGSSNFGVNSNKIFYLNRSTGEYEVKSNLRHLLKDKNVDVKGLFKIYINELYNYIITFDENTYSSIDYPCKEFINGSNVIKMKVLLLYERNVLGILTPRRSKYLLKHLGIDIKDDKNLDVVSLNIILKKELFKYIPELENKSTYAISKCLMQYTRDMGIDEKRDDNEDEGEGELEGDENSIFDNDREAMGIKYPGSNILYYGVPGCGKSYNANKELKNFDEYDRILFHPDYTYSDFIGQLLPKKNKETGEITYEFVPGPFTRILEKAIQNPDKNYCLVIEEINRGNASAIFGDIFQLLDRLKKDNDSYKKGDSEYPIKNATIAERIYGNDNSDKEIIIPNNLSLIATMNSSDQNVFVLDTAFKRRWIFKKVSNEFNESHPYKDKEIGNTGITWKNFVTKINEKISLLSKNGINGDDKQIGKFFVSEDDLDNVEIFAEKVLLYLWEDVVKFNKTLLFKEEYTSIDKLIKGFTEIGFAVFKDEVFGDNNEEDLDEESINE